MSHDTILAEAISELSRAIDCSTQQRKAEFEWCKSHEIAATLKRLEDKIDKVMSAISDFATAVQAFFDRQDTAITDLQGDVKNLTDQIAALQASQGKITPEDQALLDGIQGRAKTVADKLDALDALTPPVAPPPPPPA